LPHSEEITIASYPEPYKCSQPHYPFMIHWSTPK